MQQTHLQRIYFSGEKIEFFIPRLMLSTELQPTLVFSPGIASGCHRRGEKIRGPRGAHGHIECQPFDSGIPNILLKLLEILIRLR